MSLEQVQQCLISLFTGLNLFQPTQIAWENATFTPTKGTSFCTVHFMPSSEIVATLGLTGKDQNDGLFQITIYLPKGSGELTSRTMIETLRTCYNPRSVTYQGQPVLLLGRYRANGMTVDDFYAIPFTVRWRAIINRN